MLDQQEWLDETLNEQMVDTPLPLSVLKFSEKPRVLELADHFNSRFEDFRIISDYSFWYKDVLFEIELEKYRVNNTGVNTDEVLELSSFGIMLDTDIYNDIGEGTVYHKNPDTKTIESNQIVLTSTNVMNDLYMLSLRDITPDPNFKTTVPPSGYYLVLTKIKVKNVAESSYLEIDIFVGGNESSFYYNRVTNHKFDGGTHIDAAGDLRVYPDINYEYTLYVPDQPIALCQLTDDFSQRIITIEDDYKSGQHANDENTTYSDYYRKETTIYGKLPSNSSGQTNTRYFRLNYDNPSNNDDIAKSSEIRDIKISNVSTSETLVSTPDVDYWIKKTLNF